MIGQMHTGIRFLIIGLLVIIPAAYGFGSHDYNYERNRDLSIILAASQYHNGYAATVSCPPSTIQVSGENIKVNTVNTVVHQLSNGTWVCTSDKPTHEPIIITSSSGYKIEKEASSSGGFSTLAANTTLTNTTHYDTGMSYTQYYYQSNFNQTEPTKQIHSIENMTTQTFTTSPFNQVISSFTSGFNSSIFSIMIPGIIGITVIGFLFKTMMYRSSYPESSD